MNVDMSMINGWGRRGRGVHEMNVVDVGRVTAWQV